MANQTLKEVLGEKNYDVIERGIGVSQMRKQERERQYEESTRLREEQSAIKRSQEKARRIDLAEFIFNLYNDSICQKYLQIKDLTIYTFGFQDFFDRIAFTQYGPVLRSLIGGDCPIKENGEVPHIYRGAFGVHLGVWVLERMIENPAKFKKKVLKNLRKKLEKYEIKSEVGA